MLTRALMLVLLALFVAAAEARPEWAVRVAPDEITVAYRAAGDAADLLR